jgi:cephalosporin-C deacetylase-like acetyl esterase
MCKRWFYLALGLGLASSQAADSGDARPQLIQYLNGLAQTHLDSRKAEIAKITTRADAERRKALVKRKILSLIGGLPEHRGPVAVKEFGTVTADGFRLEKVAYESLPGFWVTANVYVPATGTGPFPAVLLTPGHGAAGKQEDWNWGGNLARNGIVALAYDPLGQGERLQYFDPPRKASQIGNPTGEHGEANVPVMLLGEDLARYMVNDAIRGVDYLTARKDVDAARIGAFGCSGGGTATAYFAALEDRVKVAISACYITSFQELLPSPTGVQDAEQSIPHFIEQGLDFGDWIEVFAPKPYGIASTTEDMFPFAGARQTYEEAKRIYQLYDAGDRLQWFTGPGGHGNLIPMAPKLLGFLAQYLKSGAAEVNYTTLRPEHREDMICTPGGQVSTSIGGETIYSLNRKRADALLTTLRTVSNKADLDRLRARTKDDIRSLTAVTVRPGAKPHATLGAAEQRGGYQIETIRLEGEDNLATSGRLAIPDREGPKAAVLMMSSMPIEKLSAADGDFDRLAKSGRLILALEARPDPPGTESIKSPYLGVFNLLSLRAFLVGKTLLGMRLDDVLRGVDYLATRPDIDRAALTVYGEGPAGPVMLHAAALDDRIQRVVVESSLTSYRMIVDQPVHRNVSEVVIPGVLKKYDLSTLLLAIYPRRIEVVNPKDALGEPVSEADWRKAMGNVLLSEAKFGATRVQVQSRGPQDPLSLD